MSKKKSKSKIGYIILALLAVIIIGAGVIIATHWDLVKTAWIGLTHSPEELAAQTEVTNSEIEESLGITGMITEEMVAEAQAKFEAQLAGSSQETPAEPSETAAPSDSSSSEDIVARYTAELYGLRGAFQGQIDGLAAAAKAEYLALPKEERTAANRNAIIFSKLGEAQAAEASCDAMVESVLQQMEAELVAAGQSTAPVGELRGYYEEIKASEKAAYFAQMAGN